jgi:hypothetical protein
MILILTVFSVHVSKECGDTSTRHLQLTNKLYVYLLTCFNPVLFLVQFSIAACIYFKRVFLLFLRTPRGIIVGTGTRPLVCFSSHSLISIVPSFVPVFFLLLCLLSANTFRTRITLRPFGRKGHPNFVL